MSMHFYSPQDYSVEGQRKKAEQFRKDLELRINQQVAENLARKEAKRVKILSLCLIGVIVAIISAISFLIFL